MYIDDVSGDNLVVETNRDLEMIIKVHIQTGKLGREDIMLHILEVSQKRPTDIFSCVTACKVDKLGRYCLKCLNHTFTLYKCSQSDDYNNLCGTCIVLGKHSTAEHSTSLILDNHSKKVIWSFSYNVLYYFNSYFSVVNQKLDSKLDSQFVHGSQEKKKDEPALHLDLETSKIKALIDAEVRLRLAEIMQKYDESRTFDYLI